MHDFPAYGLFCAWCVHGKFPCPVCKEALRFIWLKKGGKYSSFDKHRQFLPPTIHSAFNPDDGPEAYTNPVVYNRLHDYTAMVQEVHGLENDPSTEQIDPDVLMRVGGGKRHGWY
jgi:hypothetical protein